MEIPNPKRATGSHFYKYSNLRDQRLDWLKTILLEHKLYLPTVSQLNDPADGRPQLEPLSEEKMFQFLFTARNPTLTSSAQQMQVEVLRQNIRHHGPELLQRRMAKFLNQHMETYRVYSLSKRYDNLSLWTNYAEAHSGYCLEFANDGRFFGTAVEVFYGKSIPMDVTNPEHRRSYFLYCKREQWSNEEEVRVVVFRGGKDSMEFEPRILTRLILGMNVTDQHENTIREWAHQRGPELTVVKAYFDDFDQVLKVR